MKSRSLEFSSNKIGLAILHKGEGNQVGFSNNLYPIYNCLKLLFTFKNIRHSYKILPNNLFNFLII